MRSGQKAMALWLFLLVILVVLFNLYSGHRPAAVAGFNFAKLEQALKDGKIQSVTFFQNSRQIRGEIKPEFEKEFGISIPDDQAEKITTVGDAVAYIEANAK